MANEIYKANDVQLRQQIKAHLDEADAAIAAVVSDTAYNEATWNGVTTIAPSKNAVRDQFEALGAEVDTLVPRGDYIPGMMYYAGPSSNNYYAKTGVTVSGNKISVVIRFRVSPGNAANNQRLLTVFDSTTRCSLTVLENDHATASAQGKLQLVVQNSGGSTVASIVSTSVVNDGELYTALVDYDGDAGTATMIINGADEKDAGSSLHVLTTGTLETGTMAFHLGASAAPDLGVAGTIGFFGYNDVSGLDWADFMDPSGRPLSVPEGASIGTNWGGTPLFWNPNGQMDMNLGSAGNMVRIGQILFSNENLYVNFGYGSATTSGSFNPAVWDGSNNSSESQAYSSRSGSYWRVGDLVTISIDLTMSSLGTLTTTNGVRIGDLPFTPKTAANGGLTSAMTVIFASGLSITAGVSVVGAINPGNTFIGLQKWSLTSGTSSFLLSELTASGRLIISGQYLAD